MDVAGEVQVELFHGHDLSVAATCGTTLDAESGSLWGLSDARDGLRVEVRTESLDKSDSGGRLALTERGGVNSSDYDVVSILAEENIRKEKLVSDCTQALYKHCTAIARVKYLSFKRSLTPRESLSLFWP